MTFISAQTRYFITTHDILQSYFRFHFFATTNYISLCGNMQFSEFLMSEDFWVFEEGLLLTRYNIVM